MNLLPLDVLINTSMAVAAQFEARIVRVSIDHSLYSREFLNDENIFCDN
jgi:hypothetical protein